MRKANNIEELLFIAFVICAILIALFVVQISPDAINSLGRTASRAQGEPAIKTFPLAMPRENALPTANSIVLATTQIPILLTDKTLAPIMAPTEMPRDILRFAGTPAPIKNPASIVSTPAPFPTEQTTAWGTSLETALREDPILAEWIFGTRRTFQEQLLMFENQEAMAAKMRMQKFSFADTVTVQRVGTDWIFVSGWDEKIRVLEGATISVANPKDGSNTKMFLAELLPGTMVLIHPTSWVGIPYLFTNMIWVYPPLLATPPAP